MKGVLTVILAGGRGERLEPLTRDRTKPAVPFGGIYRIIDFTLSNCVNSGLRQMLVLIQYKARSLQRHIAEGWRFMGREVGEFVDVVAPEQRVDHHWYRGTADALYQNIYAIEHEAPELVLILAGDHIYKMDYSRMIADHRRAGAHLTLGVIEVPREEASRFGILNVDDDSRVLEFDEKPDAPKPMPGRPDRCLASMGIYVFNARVLYEELLVDANHPTSGHDFGRDIIPSMIARGLPVYVHRFQDMNRDVRQPYWRDVGTVDAYYHANMDLIEVKPILNLYDQHWPLRTYFPRHPPPKFVFAEPAPEGRRGEAQDSLISPGCIISGGRVVHSILSPIVRVNSRAVVEDSLLFEGVEIGHDARVCRAIIDKGVRIAPGTRIGFDADADRALGATLTPEGVTVLPRAGGWTPKHPRLPDGE